MNHLEIDNLTVVYGAVRAINGISIHVRQGETVGLIGPNGAGKTSLLLTVAGVVAPRSGTIKVNGRDLAGVSAEARVANGISVVPENREVFTKLNVHENLLVGASLRKDRAAIQADTDRMYALFPRLAERRQHMAGFLSGGEQQMLAIARALMAHPKLLMLDEPSLGLAPVVTDTVYEAIKDLKKGGTSVLLVEQNSERAFAVSDRAYLMQAGHLVAEGTPAQLSRDGLVEQTLFGRATTDIAETQSNPEVTP